jgi:hypothetical protein
VIQPASPDARKTAGLCDIFRSAQTLDWVSIHQRCKCGAISRVDRHLGSLLRIQFSDCGSYAP